MVRTVERKGNTDKGNNENINDRDGSKFFVNLNMVTGDKGNITPEKTNFFYSP